MGGRTPLHPKPLVILSAAKNPCIRVAGTVPLSLIAAAALVPEIGPDFSLGSTRPPIPRASAPGTTCATARSRFRAYCFPLATDLRVPHPSRLCRTRWVGSMNHPGAACLAPETPTPRHSQIRTTPQNKSVPTRLKNPQKHQQTRMSSVRCSNLLIPNHLPLSSHARQKPIINLMGQNKKPEPSAASALPLRPLRSAFAFAHARNRNVLNILPVTPLFGIFYLHPIR